MKGCPHAYQLDAGHRFEKGRPMAVCGNTGALVRPQEKRPAWRSGLVLSYADHPGTAACCD